MGWAPTFRILMGIPRQEMEAMSIPVMVDHLELLERMRSGE